MGIKDRKGVHHPHNGNLRFGQASQVGGYERTRALPWLDRVILAL